MRDTTPPTPPTAMATDGGDQTYPDPPVDPADFVDTDCCQ